VAVETGLRCSELTGLRIESLVLGRGAYVRCHGKRGKERCTPLRKSTVEVLRGWLREQAGSLSEPLFPNARGGRLSPDGLEYIVPSLERKRVTPHVLRHTAAMELLKAGVDRAVIALCLGHESIETTQMDLDADFDLKEKVLARMAPRKGHARRYRPGDRLVAHRFQREFQWIDHIPSLVVVVPGGRAVVVVLPVAAVVVDPVAAVPAAVVAAAVEVVVGVVIGEQRDLADDRGGPQGGGGDAGEAAGGSRGHHAAGGAGGEEEGEDQGGGAAEKRSRHELGQ
jgi:hypothetical protein